MHCPEKRNRVARHIARYSPDDTLRRFSNRNFLLISRLMQEFLPKNIGLYMPIWNAHCGSKTNKPFQVGSQPASHRAGNRRNASSLEIQTRRSEPLEIQEKAPLEPHELLQPPPKSNSILFDWNRSQRHSKTRTECLMARANVQKGSSIWRLLLNFSNQLLRYRSFAGSLFHFFNI